ncbi:MAG: hypothetical protein R2825_01305 [Saprospiraceae bacterium]
MNLFSSLTTFNYQDLFQKLFNASTEQELDAAINSFPEIFNDKKNWKPLGGNENSFGVIENQQSAPIASLIEKITNSIDALLMKRCLEMGIDPKSKGAPQSIEEAVKIFYPNHKYWELQKFRRQQSEDIQIVADGPPRNTSVIIYDNGEGQHPNDFEDTFLSLLRGNKNEIHFVQGKYNMGGSGAIVFCGKKRYQLIASKRFDGTGEFGFTLIRQHQLTKEEEKIRKNTWYEYLKINDKIPSFPIDELDLKLHNRKFKTGTIIKLYSYQFPSGYSGFAQDLNQSINEYLFEPALPVLTVDNKTRYPNNNVLELDLYGLKRRLDEDKDYLDVSFSVDFAADPFGKLKVTCFVFKAKSKGYDVKKTKERIRSRYFKNGMSVLFSMNGQVHGHYTSEFITRSLKMNILKDYLLIHVDCTNMNYDYRKELFMASRDRLKDGDETRELRKFLASKLGAASSRLSEIEKKRKASITVSGENTQELLKNFTQNLPMSDDLKRLLGDAFKLDEKPKEKPKRPHHTSNTDKKEKEPFLPKRFPTYLKLNETDGKGKNISKIPLGGEKTLKFETDVQNDYFDRIDEPGALKIALLNFTKNDSEGGDAAGTPNNVEDVLDVETTSPADGKIRVVFKPKEDVKVGDAIQVKVSLDAPGQEHDQIFWVKITDPKAKPTEKPKQEENIELPGLPAPILVYRNKSEGRLTWDELGASGIDMEYENVMYPDASGDLLEKIYINMNSTVLMNFKSKQKAISEEQNEIADKKYISSVYFHSLFLYTIIKNKKYSIVQTVDKKEDEVDLGTYLRVLFDSYYSEFILHFGTVDLMAALG